MVTYYNIIEQLSTTNEIGLQAKKSGDLSPMKYNKIDNFIVYGIDAFNVDLNIGDYGLENSDAFDGDMYITDGDIIPVPDDRFIIKHIPEMLFKVISVSPMKYENGNNMWKCSYKLDKIDNNENINNQTVETSTYVSENVGTDYKSVILNKDMNKLRDLEKLYETLSNAYVEHFYNQETNSFIYIGNIIENDTSSEMIMLYDVSLTSFLSKHNLLIDLLMVKDQVEIDYSEFWALYKKSIFKAIEEKDMNLFVNNTLNIKPISDLYSSFSTNTNSLFYRTTNSSDCIKIDIFSTKHFLELNKLSMGSDSLNFIISYFNNLDDRNSFYEYLNKLVVHHSKLHFYTIPLILYIIKQKVINITKKKVGE